MNKFDKLYNKIIAEWHTYSDSEERERIQRDWDEEKREEKAREQEDYYDDDDYDDYDDYDDEETISDKELELKKKYQERIENVEDNLTTMSTKELENYVYEDIDYDKPLWKYKGYIGDYSLSYKDVCAKIKAANELVHRQDCNVQKMEDFFFNCSPREKENGDMRILKENFRNLIIKTKNPIDTKINNGEYSSDKLIQALKDFHKWSTLFESKKKHISTNQDMWLYQYEQMLLDKGYIGQDVFTNLGTLNSTILDKKYLNK